MIDITKDDLHSTLLPEGGSSVGAGPSSSSRGLCVSEGTLGSVAEITESLNHPIIAKHSQVSEILTWYESCQNVPVTL